jgi:dTDP-4-amino-4,6-dideoxygalactose transaminase
LLGQSLKGVARAALRPFVPRGRGRVGRLAARGGTPVRDTRVRPWPEPNSGDLTGWVLRVRPLLRAVYLSGEEGLPQPIAQKFGAEWAKYCRARHGLLVGHGTDALRFALASALEHDGLDYGGEVIVPNLSFIASATAALDRRFGVALVDVDPATLLLDPRRVEEAIVPGRTRAIMAVHLFGQPADMTSIRSIADRHGLVVIEDAAQAHGAEWETGPVGAIGHAGAFSFQSSKVLNAGEGGALVTNDDELFERAYSMQNVGRDRRNPGRWEHATLGWNCRPTEYQAALLLHRLTTLDDQQRRRQECFESLRRSLGTEGCLEPLAVHPGVRRHGMYMFAMRYRPERCGGLEVDEFVRIVQMEGVPLHRGFQATISSQPAIRALMDQRPEYLQDFDTPVADAAVRQLVYLPHALLLAPASEMSDVAFAMEKVVTNHA